MRGTKCRNQFAEWINRVCSSCF